MPSDRPENKMSLDMLYGKWSLKIKLGLRYLWSGRGRLGHKVPSCTRYPLRRNSLSIRH